MAEKTAIEWADSTANFWIGCTKDGPGCVFCYAEEQQDHRFHRVEWGPRGDRSYCAAGWGILAKYHRVAAANDNVDPELGRRRRIFINSLADSFDDHASIIWRVDMLDLIERSTAVNCLLLTKRIENVEAMVPEHWKRPGGWPEHVWLGITVVNQEEANRDIPILLDLKARFGIKVAFLSIEPMIGPIDLEAICTGWYFINALSGLKYHDAPEGEHSATEYGAKLDWIIVGGESGKSEHIRLIHPAWVRHIQRACRDFGVPFLFKQWGEWSPAPEIIDAGGTLFHKFEDGTWMQRRGKHDSGRALDGATYTEFPDERLAA